MLCGQWAQHCMEASEYTGPQGIHGTLYVDEDSEATKKVNIYRLYLTFSSIHTE